MSLTLDIIKQLPKAELHCHLDGFCRPSTIIELAREQGVKLPTEDINELSKILTAPPDCPDLVTYLRCFDAPLDVMQYQYAITRIFYEACEDASKDGITYLELRYAPALHTRRGLSYTQILQAAVDGVHMAQQKLPITVRIICCIMRMMSPEVSKEVADVAWRFRNSGVVAFDLAGPEAGFPPHKHLEAFRTMRQKAVGVTIHAGEAFGAKSIELALGCNASRIGHGTRIVEDEKVLQQVIDRRVALECCVSSNVQTKAVKTLDEHPIKKLFDRGVITVPCTDNPTVSGVTLSGEYLLLHQKFGFNIEELVRLMDYGFRVAFVDETLKRRLRIEAITKTLRVLRENNIDITPILKNAAYFTPIGLQLPDGFKFPAPVPELTLDIVKSLTKADTDTRLIGSVPLNILYKYYTKAVPDNKKLQKFESFEQFEQFIRNPEDSHHDKAKKIAAACLQTKEALTEGAIGILDDAIADNVVYLEITVAPQRHTKHGLTEKDVIDALHEAIKAREGKILARLVLCVNIAKDSPVVALKTAQACVAYPDVVAGFAMIASELTDDNFHFYDEVFEFLRNNYVNVSMFAGEKHPSSVQLAIVQGNARRIAGGFKIAESDSLHEVASNAIPVLCKPSPRFSSSVAPVFADYNVRSLYDFGVRVAYVSVHGAFDGKTRSQELFEMCQSQGFGPLELIMILNHGFCSIFQHYDDLKKLQNKFWTDTIKNLTERGFHRFLNPTYHV